MNKRQVRISKFLSLVLRHKPEKIGLRLDEAGWALQPPPLLYHGTARRFLDSIFEHGLEPGGRQHVHLSTDTVTAVSVGQRHGQPVVLRVASAEMAKDGHEFYCSENGVWLTEQVPTKYLCEMNEGDPTRCRAAEP